MNQMPTQHISEDKLFFTKISKQNVHMATFITLNMQRGHDREKKLDEKIYSKLVAYQETKQSANILEIHFMYEHFPSPQIKA